MRKEYQELYAQGNSIHEVSNMTGIPLSTLRFRLKRLGLLRSRTDAIKLASSKGKLGSGMRGKNRVFSQSHKDAISKARTGTGLGYRINSKGYKEFTTGRNKGRCEHVVLVESVIGRKIHTYECVHHIDEDKLNNNLNNLRLMTKSEHMKLHALENLKNRTRDQLGRFL